MSRTKKFIDRNDEFTCLQCGAKNNPSDKSCRNHCSTCLYSRHVDEIVPGDRGSDCKGLMKPIGLDYSGKKGQMILHQCLTCEKRMKNMVSPDDNQEVIVSLSRETYSDEKNEKN